MQNNQYSSKNLEDLQMHDHFFTKRIWTPKLTIHEIIQNCIVYAQQNIQKRESVQVDFLTNLVYTIRKSTSYLTASITILLVTFMLRILMGFGSYSGQNDPPRFGDFEAQRHWMELTMNLRPQEWYRESSFNDLTWWRLDYPPLSGYLAWLIGYFSKMEDPKSVEPYESRGYEETLHKNFMRWSVLIADLIFLYPILVLCMMNRLKKFNFDYQLSAILVILSCPFLIIVDHGHFQYNCIAIGLSLWGVWLCSQDQLVFGSVMFTCALNFKQMSLYYSLGFFAFILGKIAISSELRSQNRLQLNYQNLLLFFGHVGIIGFAVITTTLIIWFPWLSSLKSVSEVISAIFPVYRGLYQLQVATFWCISHAFIEWENLFTNSQLISISTLLTFLLSIPSMACLIINPKYKNFTIGLFVISQLFYLFGFQVHEKTILLPLVFLIINIRSFGHIVNDYVTIAGITLYPMMHSDGLIVQFFVLWVVYQLIFHKYIEQNMGILIKNKQLNMEDSSKEQHLYILLKLIGLFHRRIMMKIYIGLFLLFVVLEQILIPMQFPFLYAIIGFLGFVFTLVQVYIYQIRNTIQSLNKQKQD